MAKYGSLWLIQDAEHGYDIFVLGLRDELCKDSDVVERALSVGVSHRTVQKVDCSEASRVIPAVLASGDGVQIKIDAQAVFACPFDSLQEISKERRLKKSA